MKIKNLLLVALFSLTPLLIPWFMMQIADDVNWSFADFAMMGGMLLILGQVLYFLVNATSRSKHAVALTIVVLLLFLLTWAELGVGLFGTPFAGN